MPLGKSAAISCAVVRTWTSMLAALSNCCGIHAPGALFESSATISCARAIAPLTPFSRGVSSKRRAVGEHQAAPLDAHAVGHDEDDRVALDGADHRQADARVARGRLDDRRARLERARRLCRLDHRDGDPVLDRAARVRALALDVDVVARAEQPVDADVRRVADGVQDVVGEHAAGPSQWRVAAIMVRARRQSGDARAPRQRHLPARLPVAADRRTRRSG